MRDIFPPNNKRSIRNVTLSKEEDKKSPKEFNISSESGRKVKDFKVKSKDQKNRTKHTSSSFEKKGNDGDGSDGGKHLSEVPGNGGRKKMYLAGGALGVFALLVVGFGVSSQFAVADIDVEPIATERDINETLNAKKEPSSDELGYQLMSVNLENPLEKVVETEGSEEVEEKASGEITIYNEHDRSEQRLVENTRFESPDGLIFRIQESVTVPGMQDSEPGKLKVNVVADEAGEEYNIEPTTFTIPGFQGSARFDGFYAESSSEMQGGIKGEVPVMEDEKKEEIKEELKNKAVGELKEMVSDDVPEGFILFDSAYYIKDDLNEELEEDKVKFSLDAELLTVILKEQDLANHLYERISDNEEKTEVEVKNWDGLELSLDNDEDLSEKEKLSLTFQGNIRFFEKIDTDALASELTGVSKNDKDSVNKIMEKYPVNRAEVSITPPWVFSFPQNTENINVNINY